MEDRSSLLDQLRIDRSAPPASPPSRRWWRVLLLLALVLAALALLLRPRPLDVTSVVVPPLADGAASVLDASGYVVARRQATVSSKITGKVIAVHLEEGRRVEAGEVLARIDDSNLRAQLALAQAQETAARSQLGQVEVQLAEAERQLARHRRLAAEDVVPADALETVQARADALRAQLASLRQNVEVARRAVALQQRALDDTVVRAPFAGVITVKNAQPGEMISPLSAGGAGTRTGIGTLVDMESLEVEVDVNENFLQRVRADQHATARLNAWPDWAIPARVIAVIPTADRSKATVKVRLALEQKDERVLPEMGVRVSFHDGGAERARGPKLPRDVLHGEGAAAAVFVIGDDGRLQRRAVTLGASDDGEVEVLTGVAPGELLALGPRAALADGRRVRVVDAP